MLCYLIAMAYVTFMNFPFRISLIAAQRGQYEKLNDNINSSETDRDRRARKLGEDLGLTDGRKIYEVAIDTEDKLYGLEA